MVRPRTLGTLVLLVPSLAYAGSPAEVSEPENLPPPKQAQVSDTPAAGAPPTVASFRKSVTLEASLGVGGVVSTISSIDTGLGLSGLNLGIGGFLNPQLAITGRLVGVLTGGSNNVSQLFFGGAVQYWINDKLWAGAGAGLAYLYANTNTNGFGFEVRGGYTVKQIRAHAFHVSLEVTPSLFDGHLMTAFAVLGGYQYL